jgi:hypothetical protein
VKANTAQERSVSKSTDGTAIPSSGRICPFRCTSYYSKLQPWSGSSTKPDVMYPDTSCEVVVSVYASRIGGTDEREKKSPYADGRACCDSEMLKHNIPAGTCSTVALSIQHIPASSAGSRKAAMQVPAW